MISPRSKNKNLFEFNLLNKSLKLVGIITTLLFKWSLFVKRTKTNEEITLISP